MREPTTSRSSGNGAKVNNVGSSMTFTAPAGTAERTLKVYAFGWYSNMQLEVTVSDSSFATYTTSTTGDGSGSTYFRTFTITYTAGSDNQTVTVKLKNVAGQQTWGQVGLQGAALSLTGGGGGGTIPSAPTAPTGVSATAITPSRVDLSWGGLKGT